MIFEPSLTAVVPLYLQFTHPSKVKLSKVGVQKEEKKKSSVWTWGSLGAPQFMVTSGKAAQSKYTPADSKQRVMLETTPEPKKSLLRMKEKLQKILWLTDFKKNSWIQETFRNRSTDQCYKKSMVLNGDNVNVNQS